MSISTGNITTTVGNAYVSTGATAITFMTLCNYTAGNVFANVYVVPSGDVASNLNCILSSIEIAALDTYQLYAGGEKLLLADGDSVQANSSADNSISTVVSYTSI